MNSNQLVPSSRRSRRIRPVVFALGLVSLAACPASRANVRLPAVFGDHMLLQRDQPIPVWGRADQAQTTTADDGNWRVALPAHRAGGPHTLVVRGQNRIAFSDVLVGDVWLCSGQSNMTFRVNQADRAQEEITAANFPAIRLFTVKRAVAESPQFTCAGEWAACNSSTVDPFSAVAYFFGRTLHHDLGVPIGLIHSSWGGTKAEAWTPHATLEASPELRPILEHWAGEVAAYPRNKAAFEANYVSSTIKGPVVRISLAPETAGLATRDHQPLRGFTIAGSDHRFVPATARIAGGVIEVSSPDVPQPVAVRYAWADNPDCNLVSTAGLPASPFRTDDWPEVTFGRK